MYQAGLEIIIMASGFALTKKRLVKGNQFTWKGIRGGVFGRGI